MKASPRATGAHHGAILAQALVLAVLAGCDHSPNQLVDRIQMVSGDNQCALAGELLPEPLTVRVLGPLTRDFLGRNGPRSPAVGVEVTFEVENLEDEEEPGDAPSAQGTGSDPAGSPATALMPYPTLLDEEEKPGELPSRIRVLTDSSGVACVRVRLGSQNGDWRIEAVAARSRADSKLAKEHFRLVTGVEKLSEIKEANVGEKVPLELRIAEWVAETGELRDLDDREVYFRIVGQPSGVAEPAAISNQRDKTNKKGIRGGSSLTLGDQTGVYYVLAEVEPYREKLKETSAGSDGAAGAPLYREDKPIRGILFRFVAMDWPQVALKILGGALLFLIGVRFFGSGFLLILSARLPLEENPWTASRSLRYLGGVAAGAAFQSWSTVSSHLTSFANGGFLTAKAALMPLLGASLGATVLPQILSLELSFLSVPLLAVGIFLFLLPRTRGTHAWGWAGLGLGLLLASWSILGEGIGLLALSDNFRSEMFPENVDYSRYDFDLVRSFFAALLVGLTGGFLLRTSNLIVVFAILLSAKGLIDPATAIPLICGGNLGAALMLFASSIFKLQEARRIGLAGLIFHASTALAIIAISLIPVRGASLFLWLVDVVTPGALIHPIPESVGQHLASAHSLYNLLGSFFFLLFPALLMRLIDRWMPPRKAAEEVKPYKLDADLIPVPSLALRQATLEVVYLTELCEKSVAEAFDSFRYADLQLSDHLLRRGETIREGQRDAVGYLVLVAENELSSHDARRVEILQSTVSGLAGIAACAERLRDLSSRRIQERIDLLEDAERDLGEVYDLVITQFDNVVTLLQKRTSRVEENTLKQIERIAIFRSRLEAQSRKRVESMESEGVARTAVFLHSLILQEAFEQLFLIASHLSHIAGRIRMLS
ncbi:MAG: Na/Pi cotransporter family protein [Planctomycetes bacterium]|nr:Na/Pi cotransporter family protein [Planctomycetota bacterium]